jgi:hypothetical protein
MVLTETPSRLIFQFIVAGIVFSEYAFDFNLVGVIIGQGGIHLAKSQMWVGLDDILCA